MNQEYKDFSSRQADDVLLPVVYEYKAADILVQVADVNPLLSPENFEACLPLVSQQRREKTLAYRHVNGRSLSLGAGLLLDTMLRQHGLCEREMEYVMGQHGKPALAGHEHLHFNISHTSHYVACAIGKHQLGIDIEYKLRRVGESLMQKTLTAEEQAFVTNSGDCSTFYRLWTLKESWFKCVGTGITDNFPAFSLSGEVPVLQGADAGCYRFFEFSFSDCCGALCVSI